MNRLSKRTTANQESVSSEQHYSIDQAIALLKKTGNAKFQETIDIAINLGIDSKKSDQNVRGSTVLPNGTGKLLRVIVFAQGEDADTARNAGADEVGFEDLAEKIKTGFCEFDMVIATPDSMRVVGPLGQILGPKGMMPNPKDGTVTKNLEDAVNHAKAGQVRFRSDKGGVVHCSIGKIEFSEQSIKENLKSLLDAIIKNKPSSAKGTFIKKVTVSSTMGPGIIIDQSTI
ncbi:MAG TPA: 50S ribosomal protein L1 [Gammaproteobacteria bacterium]|jgi:large subunit ribosomal protein L1|nr:50S ribosomal protein L1 [Gammaproteobacteria bacterium]HJP41964.1 50S ribosomal protein L1 [Gammaproteobacteria bacterium]|tara:strand:+ start:422 stop:1111 length:690 start_codon:yes stop_codon:yes gene_type:complete